MAIAKAVLAILKNSGKAGERVRKFLNEGKIEVEDFAVNTLLKKDKRSINEIIKEDGEAGVKKLDSLIREKITTRPPAATKFQDVPMDAEFISKGKKMKKTGRASAVEVGPGGNRWGMKPGRKVSDVKPKDPVKKAKGGMVTKWESKWG